MKRMIIWALAALPLLTNAQNMNTGALLPQPTNAMRSHGQLKWGKWKLTFQGSLSDEERAYLQQAAEALPTGKEKKSTPLILTIEPMGKPEAYNLAISNKGVQIKGSEAAGLFYGLQTLIQLTEQNTSLSQGVIVDLPRFGWRGLMLDVSRHFRSKEFIKRQLDLMARYKLNTLHLHLTDGAGWRMEVKRYPRLTQLAAWRPQALWKDWWQGNRHYAEQGSKNAYGGYYTQEDLKEIVAYARARFINIVPEIEMPAHSEEVTAAYPELSCSGQPYKEGDLCPGEERTYTFLEGVLQEVMDIFPSHYIHIGGDEASMASWDNCPLCQQRMMAEGLTHREQLQGYLMRRMAKFLQQNGREAVGWDELLTDSVPPQSTVMVWRDERYAQEAIRRGIPIVLSPSAYCYLDYYQDVPTSQPEAIGGYIPLAKTYQFDPPTSPLVRGVQANLWTEYIPTEEHAEYMLWPRAMALAEVGWTNVQQRDSLYFRQRVLKQVEWMQQHHYHPFDLAHEKGARPESRQPLKHLAVHAPVSYAAHAPFAEQYKANGSATLTDGWRGGWTYSDGRWQGFVTDGLDVTVDLKEQRTIHSVEAEFMQSVGAWVHLPTTVNISGSTDGTNFVPLSNTRDMDFSPAKDFAFRTYGWKGKAKVRYVRFQATCPRKGGWLFTDEIVIK